MMSGFLFITALNWPQALHRFPSGPRFHARAPISQLLNKLAYESLVS